MGALVFFIICVISVHGQKTIDVDRFETLLQEAAAEVLEQHMYDMAQLPQPPKFNMPNNFMRSFVPDTGVANREELVVESIEPVSFFSDASFRQWRYKRFNSTDYVLGINEHQVVLHVLESDSADYLYFKDDIVFTFSTDQWTHVVDVVMYTKVVKYSSVLYVAILTQGAELSLVNTYEIYGETGILVAINELNLESSMPKKLAFVQSQYGSSLVILRNSFNTTDIIYQRKGSSEQNHYIEVYFPGATDIISFTVHGRAYMAVASTTSCEVYKLDEFAASHLRFDRLEAPLQDLVGLDYFHMGFHHYLAVAGQNEQYLYVWKSGEFSLKQVFSTQNVQQIFSSVLPTCRDEVVLFFIASDGVDVFVYNGENDMFVESDVVVPPTFTIYPGSIASFSLQKKAVLLFVNTTMFPLAFKLNTSLSPISNPVQVATEKISKYMQNIQEMLDKQAAQIKTINEVLQNAVRTSGDQHIGAHQSFRTLHSSKGTVVANLAAPILIEWDGSKLTMEDYKRGTQELERNIETLESMVEEIEKIIPDIVRVDEDAVITGRKIFSGAVSGSSISAFSVNLNTAAGINVPQLQKQIYRADRPQKIEGVLTFEKPLIINGDLEIGTTVNGIDISEEVMTTDTTQTSYAAMTFQNNLLIQGDLFVSGKLNGIDVADIVTLGGNHTIVGHKSFLSGIIADNVETSYLDGVDINFAYANALSKSRDQVVPGTKTFSGGLVTNDIVLQGYLNGYNITELAADIVRVDKADYITGTKTFTEDVTMHSTLTVGGTVNGLRIPEDLFLTDVNQTITGFKEFTGIVTAEDVMVHGTVNDLNIPDDIVTLTTDEEIPGTVHFLDGIVVEKDLLVEGLVDGVDVVDIARQALKVNETAQFHQAVFTGPVTITGNLMVQGMVNNISLGDVVQDIVFKDDAELVVESEKHFKKVVTETVNLERMINGYNIDTDFMKVRGNQVINGTKIFRKPVRFNSIQINDGKIGGLDIHKFYEKRLSLIIDEEEIEEFEFTDHIIVEGDLTVHGTIGGLKIPEDVVLKTSTDPIKNKVFKNIVKIDDLVVSGNAYVYDKFGGIDLEEFNRDRITLTGDQIIEGDIWLGNSTSRDVELTGHLNGLDFAEFANNVMSKTKDQVVRGEKIFTGDTIVLGPITTSEGINGISLASMNDRAFKINQDNIIKEHVQFEDITVRNMEVAGLINGINLTKLADDSLKKYADVQYVTGHTVFEAGFHVEGDIEADTVNDLVIPDHILLKDRPQDITGQFTVKSLNVAGDLNVGGYVNGLDLSEVAPRLAVQDNEITIESDVTFEEPIHIFNDIEVTGLVNGIDLKNLADNILLKSGDQTISGRKILKGPVTIRGDVDVEYVNGVKWSDFLEDIVRTDRPQSISTPITFAMDVEAENIQTEELRTNLLNGRSLEDFLNDVVFIDIPANISGTKTFMKDVEVTGNMNAILINGLDLHNDVITLICHKHGSQSITGEKVFQHLTVYGDIFVSDTVNTYNLYELYKNTLLIEGNQTVWGPKLFNGETVFQQDVHVETVNGMKLRDELVTLHTDQELYGPIVFEGDVFIQKNLEVNGLVNGVNITELAAEAVYLDSNDVIHGSYHFQNATVASDVTVAGLVNGLSLPLFDRNVTEFWEDAEHSVSSIDDLSQDNCALAMHLQDVLSKSYYMLDGFALHQTFDYPASFIHTRPSQELTFVYLDDNPETGVAVQCAWDSKSKKFLTTSPQRSPYANVITQRVEGLELSVNIGIYEKDSFVSLDGSSLNLPGGFREADLFRRDDKILVALLFPARGICEIYGIHVLTLTSSPEAEYYGPAHVGKDAKSVAIFDVKNITFLAVARHQKASRCASKIYMRKSEEGWEKTQPIDVMASSYVKHYFYLGYHYLFFNSIAPIHQTMEPKSIRVYRNSGPNDHLFSLFQTLPFDDAKGLEFFEYGDISQLHLTTWNSTTIQVFGLEGESGFKSSYTIDEQCIRSVRTMLLDGEVYLAVGRQDVKRNRPMSSILYKGLTKGYMYSPHSFEHC